MNTSAPATTTSTPPLAATHSATITVDYEQPETDAPGGAGVCSTRHAWARVPVEPTQTERAAPIAAQADFVEIEVETLDQLRQALDAGATMVLLDNMGLPTLHEAVRINAERGQQAILEISGGVTLDGLRALAETGVDRISIGTLTKDVQSIDYSMRFEALEGDAA